MRPFPLRQQPHAASFHSKKAAMVYYILLFSGKIKDLIVFFLAG